MAASLVLSLQTQGRRGLKASISLPCHSFLGRFVVFNNTWKGVSQYTEAARNEAESKRQCTVSKKRLREN